MSQLINTTKALNKFGKDVVQDAQRELGTTRTIRGRKVRRVMSDTLRKSLFYQVFNRKGNFRVGFSAKGDANKYASFIHYGVNGTKIKYGSPFSFKKKYVNIGAMQSFIRKKPVRLRDKDGQFIKMNDKNIKAAAFLMARSVAQKGIPPVPYYQIAIEKNIKKNESAIIDAIAKDAFKILEQ